MTVKELMDILSSVNPDMEIFIDGRDSLVSIATRMR